MRPKLRLLSIAIVTLVWVLFAYTLDLRPKTIITQTSSATTPVWDAHPHLPRAFVGIDPNESDSTDKISFPRTVELTDSDAESPVRSFDDDELRAGLAIGETTRTDILQELGHAIPGNRIAAIQQLHQLDPVEAVQVLKEVLSSDGDPYVRGEAVIALVDIGGEDALATMTTALGDQDASVRSLVVQALGEAGSETTHLLGQVLFADPDPELRRRAVEAIALQGGVAADAFLAAAARDPDEGVRQLAILLVPDHEWEVTTAADHDLTLGSANGSTPDDQLLEQLRYLKPEERITAIQQVYGLDQIDAARILSKVLSRDEDANVRTETIRALVNIGGKEAFAAMTVALGDTDPEVRHQVVMALGQAGSDMIHVLGQVLLSDPDPALRRRAVELIAKHGGAAAQAFLQMAAEDTDENVRLAARQFNY